MKKKMSMLLIYAEAIVYIVALILSIYLCFADNIHIRMLPIALMIGVIGQVTFGKKIMTTFFCTLISLVLTQIKNPSHLGQNMLETLKIALLVLIGEGIGWSLKRVYRLAQKKKNVSKNIKIEKAKCASIGALLIVVGLVLGSIFNGNYISYSIARNKLKEYFVENYNSGSRFRLVSANYNYPVYTFYVQDSLRNNMNGKFNIHTNEHYAVHDSYAEQVNERAAKDLNDQIDYLKLDYDMEVYAQTSSSGDITLVFNKIVDNINKEEIATFATQIEEIVTKIKELYDSHDIYQLKLVLESKNNSRDNLSSYIFMSGYNQMLKNNENIVEYITNALNIEYFD